MPPLLALSRRLFVDRVFAEFAQILCVFGRIGAGAFLELKGEDQRVEFFKKNSERVIISDDTKVSDSRSGEQQSARSERPANLIVNFNGGALTRPLQKSARPRSCLPSPTILQASP